MDIQNAKHLIGGGESNTIEFKTSTSNLCAAFKTVCAFLNSSGGHVFIGVNDDGKLIGQEISDKTRREIAKEKKKIEPSASIEIYYLEIQGTKSIIAIQVEPGEHLPYVYDGRPYQRDESETSRMPQHHYEQLLVKRGQLNHSWEEFTTDKYTLNDLDQEEIYQTVLDGIAEKRIPPSTAKEDTEKILKQLKLTVDEKLKRAAVALYGKEIESGNHPCWLKMARFRGTDKLGEFMDNQRVYCNVFQMLTEADNFIRKHLPMASYFKPDQFQRVDKLALPVLAVREALVNAICHRNYQDKAGYISIAIFDDRMEIWNNGTLPSTLKIPDLKRKHDSVLRNELISNVFYLRGFIEAWGTGTLRMIDYCKENKIPLPKFSERTGGFVVTFQFSDPIGVQSTLQKQNVSGRQAEILALLKVSPLNSAQITEQFTGKANRRTIQLELAKLEKAGLVRREGESRSLVWYLIT